MLESKDSYLESLLANPKMQGLPAPLSEKLELELGADELCGPDAELDELLEKAERECGDLGERLLVEMYNRLGPSDASPHASADPRKKFSALARSSEAASRILGKMEGFENYWAQARTLRSISLRMLGELCEDSVNACRILARSIEVAEETFQAFPKEASSIDWAKCQENLSQGLIQLASRMESGAGTREMMLRSVRACDKALLVLTKQDDPDSWASLHGALGYSLLKFSEHVDDDSACFMLARAGKMQETALETIDRKTAPSEWAHAKEILGSIRMRQAEVDNIGKASVFFAAAARAFKAALRAMRREEDPAHWACTQANFASALCGQAECSSKESATELYRRAAEGLKTALEAISREDSPDDFVEMSAKLGEALFGQAQGAKGKKKARLLERAVEAFEIADHDLNRESHAELWAQLRQILAKALRELARIGSDQQAIRLYRRSHDLAREAMAACDERQALAVRIAIRNLLGNILLELGCRIMDRNESPALFSEAKEHYEDGLRLCEGNHGEARTNLESNLESVRMVLRKVDEEWPDARARN